MEHSRHHVHIFFKDNCWTSHYPRKVHEAIEADAALPLHIKEALIRTLTDQLLRSKLEQEERAEEHHLFHHSRDAAKFLCDVSITPDFDVQLGDFAQVQSHRGLEEEDDDGSSYEDHYGEPGFFRMTIGVKGSDKIFRLKGFVTSHHAAAPQPMYVQPHGAPLYGAPPATYGAPPATYGAPPPAYGAPPPAYGAPPPAYGAPPAVYGAPPPAYGAPPQVTYVVEEQFYEGGGRGRGHHHHEHHHEHHQHHHEGGPAPGAVYVVEQPAYGSGPYGAPEVVVVEEEFYEEGGRGRGRGRHHHHEGRGY